MLDRIRRATSVADVIELRIDCLDAAAVNSLLDNLPKIEPQYLITFRPRAEGGYSDATLGERLKFWSSALNKLQGHDFLVDYESDIDFPLHLDADRTIVSRHFFEVKNADLSIEFKGLSQLTGKTIKIAVNAAEAMDAVDVWKLLDNTDGKNVIPIAMGEAGKWTRILGLAHGSPMTYASLETTNETAPGQIPASDLTDVFRVKELDSDTSVYGIVAGDTSYSFSPYMHNAAFKHAGTNSVFVPLQVRDFDAFMRRMVRKETREVALNFCGFSVTNPHKQTIMDHLDSIDETAKKIGAVNTVKIVDDKLHGYNTDAPGFIRPLKSLRDDLRDARVAIVGGGGGARAVVYALKQEGADVTLFVRDAEKAKNFEDEFVVAVQQLRSDEKQLAGFDVLVNATPMGTRGSHEDETPATSEELRNVAVVYDLVYNPSETRLLKDATTAGAKTIGGLDMLIAQGARQYEIWTGGEPPVSEMREAVEKRLK